MKSLLVGVVLLSGVGCMNITPLGPMAKVMPAKPKPADPSEPQIVPAPKPVPPASLIQPSDVTDDNPNAAVQKLLSELEADRKTMPANKTAEVSRIKGGVKVE
jgi:hypothetical protein